MSQTPKGKDESILEYPPGFEELEYRDIKLMKHAGWIFLKGGKYTTKILDELNKRRKDNRSIVIIVTGEPGEGKTYFAIRLAQILDKNFKILDTPAPDPTKDVSQVVFTRSHLTYLTGNTSPIKRGQVIIMDESHFSIGSRKWQDRDQQDLVDRLAAIRNKGIIFIIVALHQSMLDKIIRNFVLTYRIAMSRRGKGVLYRLWIPRFEDKVFRKRKGTIELKVPDYHLCTQTDCLRCKYLNSKPHCMTIRAKYERRKTEFQQQMNSLAVEKAIVPTRKLNTDEIVVAMTPFVGEMVASRYKKIDRTMLRVLIREKLGESVSTGKSAEIAAILETKGIWTLPVKE